jgi:hypothetical protein
VCSDGLLFLGPWNGWMPLINALSFSMSFCVRDVLSKSAVDLESEYKL